MSDVSAPSSAPSAAPSTSSASAPSAPEAKASPSPAPSKASGLPIPGADLAPGSKGAPDKANPPKTAAQTAAEKRKYKLKVDGAELEEELSDDEIAVRLQKGKAAEKRMAEAAEVRKQFAALKQLAKERPEVLLKELGGVDPREWAYNFVSEAVKEEVMPETEKKQLQLQRELETYKKQVEDFRKAEEQKRFEAEQQRLEKDLESKFQRAFEASGLEWSPDNIEIFGKIALDAHDYGIELTPEQMAAEAKAQIEARERTYQERVKSKALGLKGDDLLGYLGDDVVKEVLKAAVAKHKAGTPKPPTDGVPDETVVAPKVGPTEPRTSKAFLTTDDWRKAFKQGL
jgi:hypothetical protein